MHVSYVTRLSDVIKRLLLRMTCRARANARKTDGVRKMKRALWRHHVALGPDGASRGARRRLADMHASRDLAPLTRALYLRVTFAYKCSAVTVAC